jgi:hypothetical protein
MLSSGDESSRPFACSGTEQRFSCRCSCRGSLERHGDMTKHLLGSVSRSLWHRGIRHRDAAFSLPWWRSQVYGYPIRLVLVIMTMLISLVVREPHFVWAPFCLLFVLVGWVGGVGPALVTLTLGFLAFVFFVVPQYEEAMFGEGWGLGLTMSRAIVERHGEHLQVETADETGVTCCVRLPWQAGKVPPQIPPWR